MKPTPGWSQMSPKAVSKKQAVNKKGNFSQEFPTNWVCHLNIKITVTLKYLKN